MSKGGDFENEVAVKLSLWFSDNKRDDIFGRSDGSGGRFTSRMKKGKDTANQGGDITFIDEIGAPLIKIWNIEAKAGYSEKKKVMDADGDIIKIPVYSSKAGETDKIIKWKDKTTFIPWDILDFIDSRQKKPILQQFWEQCKRDADITKRHPILIFRRNGKQICICITKRYYLSRATFFGHISSPIINFMIGNDPLVIISLKNFFEWAQPACGFLNGEN